MHWLKNTLTALPVVALALLATPQEADACGGCFVPPDTNTQVIGHGMILSVSMQQTTLIDQIAYSGDPESFAWVLPIKGEADIGVVPDLFPNQLDFDSAVQVFEPPIECPYYPGCGGEDAPNAFGSAASGGQDSAGEDGGVEVISQEVVGPYETVQLSADDPEALNDWLDGHGYSVPDDIAPVIAAYVEEDFNFLALKLVPSVGVDAMQPVSVTIPGAAATLPLRMVGAGTGAVTPVTLFVLSDGAMEPTSHPSTSVSVGGILWDYDKGESNYTELRQQVYEASNGYGWVVESSIDYYQDTFAGQIHNVINFLNPESAGYPGLTWEEAHEQADADLELLFAGLPSTVRLTRLRAELSRAALQDDLVLGARDDQSTISPFIQATKYIGTPPACPPPPDCGGADDDGFGWGGWDDDDSDVFGSADAGGGSCTVAAPPGLSAAALSGAAFLLIVAGARRRRRK